MILNGRIDNGRGKHHLTLLVEFFFPSLGRFGNHKQVVVDPNFTSNASRRYPTDVSLGLGAILRRIQAARQRNDLSRLVLVDGITNQVTTVVFEANCLVGCQPIIVTGIFKTEIRSINVKRRRESDGMATKRLVRRRILYIKGQG